MRKVTKKFNVYKYSELSEEAKLKVIEKWRDVDEQCFPIDDVIDAWKTKLETVYGFDNDLKINYTGFSSQGDGACFTCGVITNVDKFFEAEKSNLTNEQRMFFQIVKTNDLELKLAITHHGHYYHENSASMNMELYTGHIENDSTRTIVDKLFSNVEEMFEVWRYKTSKEIYCELEKTWDEWHSRECIEGDIECGDYEFLEDGRSYNE